jgi:hypothetical protein
MGMLSRVVRSSLVWAAALLTPVAGTPHVDCLCPDGHVKLFCLSFSLRPTACCGGGSCCSSGGGGCSCCSQPASVPTRHGKGKACCGHVRQRGTPAGSHLAGTTCRKTLADADAQTVPPLTASGHDHAHPVALAPAPVLLPAAAATEAGCPLSWQSHHLPPPTDRVIAFQHLVI